MVAAAASASNVDHSQDGKQWTELGIEPTQRRHYAQVPLQGAEHRREAETPLHHGQGDQLAHGREAAHHQDFYREYSVHRTDPYGRVTPHHEIPAHEYAHEERLEHHYAEHPHHPVDYEKHHFAEDQEQYLDPRSRQYAYQGGEEHHLQAELARHDPEFRHRMEHRPEVGYYHNLETRDNFQPPPPGGWTEEKKTKHMAESPKTAAPAQAPVETPTEATVEEPVAKKAPAPPKKIAPKTAAPQPTEIKPVGPERSTDAPIEAPVEAPVEAPIQDPAEAPPILEPTQEPVEEPVEEPTEEPAQEPAKEPASSKKEKAKAAMEKAKSFIAQEVADGDIAKFALYCAAFGKNYINQAEFKLRLKAWLDTDQFIRAHNWDPRSHYKVGHNRFSDWLDTEYEKLLGYTPLAEKQVKPEAPSSSSNTVDVADSIDWRDQGMVSEVVDQGLCGSDWAFATVGSVEGAFGIQQGTFVPLSVQQVLDCTGASTSCSGGYFNSAFDYLKSNYAMTAEDYPYNSLVPERGECAYDEEKATTAIVEEFTYAKSGDIDMIKTALSHQPVTAALNASPRSFMQYISGVYDDETCDETLDHAVLLVGYGSEEGEDYWIVKNSWGSTWGDKGYIRIAQKPGSGICGIQASAVWPVLK